MQQIAKIERKFGDLPIAALDDPRVTKVFRDWRDHLAESSLRQADYGWTVLLLLLDWAREAMGLTAYQVPDRFRTRLYHGDRADKIWDEQQIAAFMAVAPMPLQWALVLALETGQRQDDLLKATWRADDPKPVPPTPQLPKGAPYGMFKLVPSKSKRHDNPGGTQIAVPVSKLLRNVLDEMRRERDSRNPCDPLSTTLLANAHGHPWQGNSFRKAWEHVGKKAGIGKAIAKATGNEDAHRTFNDLRGTAITRLTVNGCPNAMIAKITGWSSRYVGDILDKYLARTDKLAVAAFAYMERTGT